MKKLLFFLFLATPILSFSQVTLIPDSNFELALISQNIDSDGALNGQVLTSDINTLTFLEINGANITDATGIEDFIALETLRLKQNELMSIDVSSLTQLKILNVQENNLTELNLSTNQNLKFLVAQINPLNSLDVSNLSNLSSLLCGGSNISSLDLSNNPLLHTFNASNANLSDLNIKNGTNITTITTFNARNNPNLNCILVDDSSYSTTNWIAIDTGAAFRNDSCILTYVPDDGFEQALINLGYDTTLDNYVPTENINTITSLDISNNSIFDITGIEDFTALEHLNASTNFLGSATVNLSPLTALKTVNIANNSSFGLAASSTINVSGCTLLESFNASNCSLQSNLDLTANGNLTEILVTNNLFSSLNVQNGNYMAVTNFNASNNPNLFCVVVDNASYSETNWTNIDNGVAFNETTTCNLTYIPDDGFEQALIDLGYDHHLNDYVVTSNINSITTIDLTAKNIVDATGLQDFTALETLVFVENFLETIDLSALTNLKNLNLYQNDLTSLDLSNLTQLETVNVGFNSLNSFNIKNNNNTNITSFSSVLNPFLSCILVDDASYSTTNWTSIDAESAFSQTNCNLTYVPNNNFEQALIDLGIVSNTAIDDYVLTSEIETVEFLIIGGRSISNLTGIEDFIALKDLNIGNNNISSLDLSSNLALQSLKCNGNPLTSLDISQNTALNILRVNETNLTEIDASNNITLNNINASNCPNLASINLQNGNNINMSGGNFTANITPNLTCIQVDDAVYSTSNWTAIDSQSFFSTASCDVTYVPDDGFEQRLINLGYDDVLNDYVVTSNINSLTSIDLRFQGIVNMTGIEGFTALVTLECQVNDITTIDISNNTNLRTVYCDRNEITTLDVSTLTELRLLRAFDNDLSSIDVSNNLLLNNLNISDNPISNLDVSGNAQLTNITASSTLLETFDLSMNTLLNEIVVNDNLSLNRFNIKNGNNAAVTTFNATGNTNLTCIEVDDASAAYLTTLPWVKDAGTTFNENCHYGETYVPDNNFEQVLINLGYDDVLDDFVLTSTINTVTTLNLFNKNISDATGIEDFVALVDLNLWINNLTTIDVSKNTLLETINLRQNNLTALNVTTNTQLKVLQVTGGNNNIGNIDVTNNALLEELLVSENNITDLDVSNNLLLRKLTVSNNQLTSLNVSANTQLTSIICNNNGISNLNLSNNSLIDYLSVSDNSLTSIDVAHLLALETIIISNNSITQLDVSNNIALTQVTISDNNLESLNVKNGNNDPDLSIFNATNNPNLTCIQVDDENGSYLNFWQKDATTSFSNFCGDATLLVSPKVILQGAMLTTTDGLMRTDLRDNLSLSEFTTSPYSNALHMSEEAYLATGNDKVVDWVWVELRDANDATFVIDGQSGVLQKDGDIVDRDGVSPISFNQAPGDYFVVIKHRNHLGIMTANTITLSAVTTSVDFTNGTNQITFGTNAQTTSGMPSGVVAMWTGNVNGDSIVQYSGTNPDTPDILSLVLNDAGNFLNFPTYAVSGYDTNDINMNGNTQYSGTNPDTPVILQNVLAHPGNFLNFSTYQIIEQLPQN